MVSIVGGRRLKRQMRVLRSLRRWGFIRQVGRGSRMVRKFGSFQLILIRCMSSWPSGSTTGRCTELRRSTTTTSPSKCSCSNSSTTTLPSYTSHSSRASEYSMQHTCTPKYRSNRRRSEIFGGGGGGGGGELSEKYLKNVLTLFFDVFYV